jgi:hypothetical protein
MSIVGDWDVTIKTPSGHWLSSTRSPTATAPSKELPRARAKPYRCTTSSLPGQRVTWRQSVTKPMRLNLEFDVVVDGDRLTGHSRAGRLPRSAVTGVRR